MATTLKNTFKYLTETLPNYSIIYPTSYKCRQARAVGDGDNT